MALTQVKTTAIADDAVTAAKIADATITQVQMGTDSVSGDEISDNAITTTELANDAVQTENIADDGVRTPNIQDDAVTADKLANSINTEITANTAKVTNATHSGEVTGATALTIADDIVDEANLKIDNSPTDDHVLTAKASAAGGLTWAAASSGGISDVVSDTTPQLGGDLDTNGNHILLDDAKFIKAGNDGDLWVGHDASHSYINHNGTGSLFVQSSAGFYVQKYGTAERLINATNDGNVELFFDSAKKLETTNIGVSVTGSITPSSGLYIGGSGGDNWLDDYEKGSWTPADAGGIVPFNTATGKYVKIGKSVTCWFYINVNVNVTSTGAVGLVGFPFTSANESGASGVSSQVVNRSHDTFAGWKIDANGTVAYGWKSTLAATTRVELWDGDVTAVSMWGDITYKTA